MVWFLRYIVFFLTFLNSMVLGAFFIFLFFIFTSWCSIWNVDFFSWIENVHFPHFFFFFFLHLDPLFEKMIFFLKSKLFSSPFFFFFFFFLATWCIYLITWSFFLSRKCSFPTPPPLPFFVFFNNLMHYLISWSFFLSHKCSVPHFFFPNTWCFFLELKIFSSPIFVPVNHLSTLPPPHPHPHPQLPPTIYP